MNKSINDLISKLELKPHPEGGFFRETYRSNGEINKDSLDQDYKGNRNYSTCIYFLLTSDNFSAFHRIKQDEIWHFYDGSPINLHIISNIGVYTNHAIGIDFQKGEVPQFVVPGGSWFAAEVVNQNDYSLIGCTVSPGFNFEDFELKSRNDLIALFPDKEEIISRLTHH
ncbi:cupin domain-containing protein [uncultured Lacinutrix sp.]|uniref:cupin domain-containing protein n=1 Tax=uncultured Lacinutrix sp. TaxID=574032 RepID=UPI00260F8783|nr:cupin domain-containing protein [uncultured Lacinutrix sp.]